MMQHVRLGEQRAVEETQLLLERHKRIARGQCTKLLTALSWGHVASVRRDS